MSPQDLAVAERQLHEQSTNHAEKAKALASAIVDDESNKAAGAFLTTIKGFRKMIDEHYRDDIKKAHELHKSLTTKLREADAPLEEAERIIKRAIGAFQAAQERIRIEEESRRTAAAQRLAEESQIAMAEDAANVGDHDRADAILNQPILVPPPIIPKVKPPEGISTRMAWKCEVLSLPDLIKAVAANPDYWNLLLPNTTALNGMARLLKDGMRVPGVRVWAEPEVSVRTR